MATARVLGTDFIITPAKPQNGLKTWILQTLNTADQNDTIAITLSDYGIAKDGLLAVKGFRHTTDGSVIVYEADTTAVASGVLTITICGAGADNKTRTIYIVGRGQNNHYSAI